MDTVPPANEHAAAGPHLGAPKAETLTLCS